MAQISPSQSLIIVGGGIVGLCIAVVALSRGHKVTVIARDLSEDTASGVAAGMIAPAMEAMNDPDPAMSFQRLKAAQTVWLDMLAVWPEAVRMALNPARTGAQCLYAPIDQDAEDVARRFTAMGASFTREDIGFRVTDDWLVESRIILAALRSQIGSPNGQFVTEQVTALDARNVTLSSGEILTADHVILAAGYDARRLADSVPAVGVLSPIKGQLLEFEAITGVADGVVRSPLGYWANFGVSAKFGATMLAGHETLAVDPNTTADLSAKARRTAPEFKGEVTPRVGIRAATPDGWPLIGRDATSGVLVATGMRRNGYVFAPLAARIVLDLIEGRECPDDQIYSPNRF